MAPTDHIIAEETRSGAFAKGAESSLTADEVRQQVLDNLRILGVGGGYILAPCHDMQAVMPAENIVAMYEMGYEHGWT